MVYICISIVFTKSTYRIKRRLSAESQKSQACVSTYLRGAETAILIRGTKPNIPFAIFIEILWSKIMYMMNALHGRLLAVVFLSAIL